MGAGRAPATSASAAVGGIDEAGRGSILGPLVVAGVSATPDALRRLGELGVKDSKLLTAERRSSLYPEIEALCDEVAFLAIPPAEIDRYVQYGRRRRKLNYLEAIHMARIVPLLGEVERVFIDAPDTNPARFSSELAEMLDPCPRLVAEHRADRNYVVVSAASIVAKVERDRAVEALRSVHGEFGSGYPSDEETISLTP
ncbi:MAG: ribonuclease HII [Nitrososphaerales archaeon]